MVVMINTDKLNKHVKRKLMTRKELSEASGVCYGTIAHMWNTPVKAVSHVTAKRLCKALDIKPDDILEDEWLMDPPCGGVQKAIAEAIWTAVDELKSQEKYRWHDLRKNPEDLPENEKPVEVAYYSEYTKRFYTARAFHEDGTMHSEETMMGCTDYCSWSDWCEYCEETDDWIIPEGWLEYVTFGEEYAMIDKEVVAWREIEPFEEGE